MKGRDIERKSAKQDIKGLVKILKDGDWLARQAYIHYEVSLQIVNKSLHSAANLEAEEML